MPWACFGEKWWVACAMDVLESAQDGPLKGPGLGCFLIFFYVRAYDMQPERT